MESAHGSPSILLAFLVPDNTVPTISSAKSALAVLLRFHRPPSQWRDITRVIPTPVDLRPGALTWPPVEQEAVVHDSAVSKRNAAVSDRLVQALDDGKAAVDERFAAMVGRLELGPWAARGRARSI
jgi:hypothetical protein